MIASSDAIGLVVSDTHIQRRHIEKAAALLRVSDCHVRLGHFEWVAMYAADYFETFVIKIIQSYYLHLYDTHQNTANISQLLHEIATNTARMIAKWQLIGFCHGVMNTDNLNITGTTLDFGPLHSWRVLTQLGLTIILIIQVVMFIKISLRLGIEFGGGISPL